MAFPIKSGSAKGFPKQPVSKKKKTGSKDPDKKTLEELGGGTRKRMAAQKGMEPGMGNSETGFIQRTPKTATGAMMGRSLPPMGLLAGSGPVRKADKKQFKPKGRKVF